MIHAVGTGEDGRAFIAFALEPGNIARLTERGEPIKVRIEDSFPEGIPRRLDVLVYYTETPVKTFNALRGRSAATFDERARSAPKQAHCPECKSTIEQLGVFRNDTPVAIVMCAVCGCVLGTVAAEAIRQITPEEAAP
jgi:hypothetical protein